MNKKENGLCVLIGFFFICYGVFGKSWYGVASGMFLIILAGLDNGARA